MTTLAEFKAIVSAEANQGTRLDSYIPTVIKRAAKFIERNYNFLYMERFEELTLDLSAASPRFVPWPGDQTKKINFVRYGETVSGSDQIRYVFLHHVDPIDILSVKSGSPQGYWQTGDETGARFLVLDQIGTEDLTLEVHSVAYSTWPTADTAEHWLINHAEDVLLAQTMRMLSTYANEPDWFSAYKTMWTEGIRTLTIADEDARNSGTADGFKMVYRG